MHQAGACAWMKNLRVLWGASRMGGMRSSIYRHILPFMCNGLCNACPFLRFHPPMSAPYSLECLFAQTTGRKARESMASMTLRQRWLPILLSGIFVVAMAAVSDIASCPEILFPEITAIVCGAWIQPRQAWNIDRPRMLLLMGSGAVFGVLLNLFMPGPMWARAVLGYAFCALMMNIVAADMTPMLSAAILPVLLGTREWVYPVAVIVLVSLVCLGQIALEHAGLREPLDYHPFRLPKDQAFTSWMKRLAVFAAISAPAYFLNQPFFAVPPLLVAYTELTRPDFTLRLRPWRGWCALAGAAMTGSLARAAVEAGALPLELALALAFVGLILIWNGLRCWLPPAGAGLLLAFLVPYHGPLMYGLEAAAGAAVWVAVAVWGFDGIRPSRETHEERVIEEHA